MQMCGLGEGIFFGRIDDIPLNDLLTFKEPLVGRDFIFYTTFYSPLALQWRRRLLKLLNAQYCSVQHLATTESQSPECQLNCYNICAKLKSMAHYALLVDAAREKREQCKKKVHTAIFHLFRLLFSPRFSGTPMHPTLKMT